MLFGSTFVCPTEIIAFSDNIQQFQAINCDVVGVSTDSHFSHLAWINTARKVVLHLVHFNFLDARYVSSIEKRSIWHQCKKYEFDYQCTTDRQPTSQFGKIQMIIALQLVNRSTSCLFLGGELEIDGSNCTASSWIKFSWRSCHISATGHPIHFLYVWPLHFALGHYTCHHYWHIGWEIGDNFTRDGS